ncbi:hypothetical protein [Aeromonas veronii]|uniref:hypothetical protein n=1 Tax=Aeromonas veronii TaxID=654 RepID=UPI003B9F7915
MKVEFKEGSDNITIFENGVLLLEIEKQDKNSSELAYYSEDFTEELVAKVLLCDATEIPMGLQFYSFYNNSEFEIINWIDFKRENTFIEIELSITFNWEDWDKPVVIGKFLELYSAELEAVGFKTGIVKETIDSWASVNIFLYIEEGRLIDHVISSSRKAKNIYEQLLIKLVRGDAQSSFVKIFNFPKEYEVICSQYILWFGELLSTLNINANVTTEIQEGKTSIIVSPNDAPELLEEIERLFYQYLALPYSEYLPRDMDTSSYIEKATSQLLYNQVENFKLQIQMKESMLQLKDATISSLVFENQKKDSELLLLKSIKNQDELKIFNGAITVGEFKWGAVKINFKKIADIFTKKFD